MLALKLPGAGDCVTRPGDLPNERPFQSATAAPWAAVVRVSGGRGRGRRGSSAYVLNIAFGQLKFNQFVVIHVE